MQDRICTNLKVLKSIEHYRSSLLEALTWSRELEGSKVGRSISKNQTYGMRLLAG